MSSEVPDTIDMTGGSQSCTRKKHQADEKLSKKILNQWNITANRWKNKTIEDLFIDLDEIVYKNLLSNTLSTTDNFNVLEKYFKILTEGMLKVSNPSRFWNYHRGESPYLAKLARKTSFDSRNIGWSRETSPFSWFLEQQE